MRVKLELDQFSLGEDKILQRLYVLGNRTVLFYHNEVCVLYSNIIFDLPDILYTLHGLKRREILRLKTSNIP